MNKFISAIVLLGIAVVGITVYSCDDKVDLLADYKATPVIYGVLDYSADTQFVRINKTYLGAGDANTYAQIKDSVEYDQSEVDVWLIKKNYTNEEFGQFDVIDSIHLEYIEVPSRDPGTFYSENVGFYYTTEPLFSADELSEVTSPSPGINSYAYEIKATIRGKLYTGETDFPTISINDIERPLPIGTPGVPRQQYYLGGNYQQITYVYKNRDKSERYQSLHRIVYDYYTSDGTLITDQISDFQLGVRPTNDNGQSSEVTFNSQSIYEFIGNSIKSDPNISKVKLKKFEFRVTAASKSLDTYIEVANPISDFTPVLSSYTNLSGGAIGILGARASVAREFYIDEMSLQQFNEGLETTDGNGHPCYCVDNWPGTVYVCADTPDC